MVQGKEKREKVNKVRRLAKCGHNITPLLDRHFHVLDGLSLPVIIVVSSVLTVVPVIVCIVSRMECPCRTPTAHPTGGAAMGERDDALRFGEAN